MGVTSFSDDHAEALATNRSIRHLDLFGTEVTGDGLAKLAQGMPQLEWISLIQNDQVTPVSVLGLASLPNLRSLYLAEQRVLDMDLSKLSAFQDLETLNLEVEITDERIEELIRIKSLVEIEFFGSELTEAGLDALVDGLPRLRYIQLYGAEVSPEKIAELKTAGVDVDLL